MPLTDTAVRNAKPKYTPRNERIKEVYYRYLAEVDGKSASTIVGICKSIVRFEEYNRFEDFSTFNREQAVGFKKHLLGLRAGRQRQNSRPGHYRSQAARFIEAV